MTPTVISCIQIGNIMTIHHFQQDFLEEETFEFIKEKEGIYCKICKSITEHYRFSDGELFECRRNSLKTGIVKGNSNIFILN